MKRKNKDTEDEGVGTSGKGVSLPLSKKKMGVDSPGKIRGTRRALSGS